MISESMLRSIIGVEMEEVQMMAGVVVCMGLEGMGVRICVEV